MNNRITQRDLAIGVLSVTAVVLLTALILVQTLMPREALAFGQGTSAGRFLLTTAKLDEATDLVIITEPSTQLMNVYGFDPRTRRVTLLDKIELDRLPKGDQEDDGEGDELDDRRMQRPGRDENPPQERPGRPAPRGAR